MSENKLHPQHSKDGEKHGITDNTPVLTQHSQWALPLPSPPKSKAQRWSKEKEAAELALDMPRRERDVATIAAFPGLSDNELSAFILNNSWKFARSQPRNPHWYVVRDQSRSEEEFTAFVKHIRKFGYIEYFWGKPYTMFDWQPPGQPLAKFWTMGWSLEATIIINRKTLSSDSK